MKVVQNARVLRGLTWRLCRAAMPTGWMLLWLEDVSVETLLAVASSDLLKLGSLRDSKTSSLAMFSNGEEPRSPFDFSEVDFTEGASLCDCCGGLAGSGVAFTGGPSSTCSAMRNPKFSYSACIYCYVSSICDARRDYVVLPADYVIKPELFLVLWTFYVLLFP